MRATTRRSGMGIALALALAAGGTGLARAEDTAAARDWKREFEEVCAKTQDSAALSTEELKGLVTRCDGLKAGLPRLEESQRKVYSRRLQLCCDLYRFVIETRSKG